MTLEIVLVIAILAIIATVVYWSLGYIFDKDDKEPTDKEALYILKDFIYTVVGDLQQTIVEDLKRADKFNEEYKERVFNYAHKFISNHVSESLKNVAAKYYTSFSDYVSSEIESAVLAYKKSTGNVIESSVIGEGLANLEECFDAIDEYLKDSLDIEEETTEESSEESIDVDIKDEEVSDIEEN